MHSQDPMLTISNCNGDIPGVDLDRRRIHTLTIYCFIKLIMVNLNTKAALNYLDFDFRKKRINIAHHFFQARNYYQIKSHDSANRITFK